MGLLVYDLEIADLSLKLFCMSLPFQTEENPFPLLPISYTTKTGHLKTADSTSSGPPVK